VTGPALTDEQLVAQSRRGDTRAFEELVRRHQDRVFNTVCRMVGDYEHACDLTQETFLNAFRGLRRFRGGAKFSTWLYRIALNAVYSHLRRQAVRPMPASGGEDPEREMRCVWRGEDNDPAAAAERKETAMQVQEALLHLRPEEREVLVLRDLEGCDYGTIAEILGCARGTVKSRLHRARCALRQLLLAGSPPVTP